MIFFEIFNTALIKFYLLAKIFIRKIQDPNNKRAAFVITYDEGLFWTPAHKTTVIEVSYSERWDNRTFTNISDWLNSRGIKYMRKWNWATTATIYPTDTTKSHRFAIRIRFVDAEDASLFALAFGGKRVTNATGPIMLLD